MYNSVYPLNIKPYVPPYVKPKGGSEKGAVDENGENNKQPSNESYNTNSNTATDPNGRRSNYGPQEFPNGQKTTIDYSKSKVNIAQILTDFKNTAIAIGSPPNILNEVEQYLSISESESLKGEPNKKRIQTNLRNAANILDEFISKTLNKKSKVVENWIDALFLQKVDYKSDPETINPDFLVKLPDKETGEMTPISSNLSQKVAGSTVESEQAPVEVQQSENTSGEEVSVQEQPVLPPKFYIPENSEIKSALLAGKRLVAAGESEKAIKAFLDAVELSMMYGDNNAEGIACYEIGKIYDKADNLSEALKFYNQAHMATNDYNLKARAYYNMAQIYDDVVYFEPAINHYFAAISFAGEAENLNAQTKALADIGDMYADRYDVENTYVYYNLAKDIALETANDKTCGAIWLRCADSLAVVNENVNALEDYKTSAKYYEKAQNPIKIARNYERAAEIMFRLGNADKANALYAKAHKFAKLASKEDFNEEIERRLGDE